MVRLLENKKCVCVICVCKNKTKYIMTLNHMFYFFPPNFLTILTFTDYISNIE